jgi:hypothetical protein
MVAQPPRATPPASHFFRNVAARAMLAPVVLWGIKVRSQGSRAAPSKRQGWERAAEASNLLCRDFYS